jgi:hypothetical protein
MRVFVDLVVSGAPGRRPAFVEDRFITPPAPSSSSPKCVSTKRRAKFTRLAALHGRFQ